MKFFEQWDKLENCKAKILLKHSLFGRQLHNCDSVKIINDDRLGVVLKGQCIYVDKHSITIASSQRGVYTVSDGRLTMVVFVNKL
jgi:hypothetical protein